MEFVLGDFPDASGMGVGRKGEPPKRPKYDIIHGMNRAEEIPAQASQNRLKSLSIGLAETAAVVIAVSMLSAIIVVGLFGLEGIARWSSWKPLISSSLIYLACLALFQTVRLRRRNPLALALQSAVAVLALAAACHVVALGKGLYPRHLPSPVDASASAATNGLDIVSAARSQIGVTVKYDPHYQKLCYPNGDVPRERGVCCDVVVRALRDARGMDLQQLVHEDMKAHFLSYPSLTRWRMLRPDASIDHRRVLNVERFFLRSGWSLEVTHDARNYLPGDIVTCLIGGELPHIMVVSDRKSDGGTPLVIHNVGSGAREEDRLFSYVITGHHRLP